MLNQFIKAVESVVSKIGAEWIVLGALIAAIAILAIGLVMTMHMARQLSHEGSIYHAIRCRARRNILFAVAFLYCLFAVVMIFTLFPGEVLLYLIIPALVAFWAFIFEALFECIDDRNRKRTGIRICYCDCCECPDCTVEGARKKTESSATRTQVQDKERAKEQPKEPSKPTAVQHVEKPKQIPARKDPHDAREARIDEIHQDLKRVQELDREREELETWRDEIRETKSLTNAEEEELRRRRFEDERKQLSILARQAQAAQFGDTAKPAPRLVTPAPKLPSQTFDSTAKSAPKLPSATYDTAPRQTVAVTVAKPAEVIAKDDTRDVQTTTTVTRTVQSSVVKSESMDAKFNSLQAKLDLLRKDTKAPVVTATKTETSGKYNETEVKSALYDLIKSMNARRDANEG